MIRAELSELTKFVRAILALVRADNEQGHIFADALIWSDLIGRPTHGVWRLPAYVKKMSMGLIKCPCSPTYKHHDLAVDVLNGDQGLGHYIGSLAMTRTISMARKFGVAAIGVCNSNHFGAGAYYVHQAAMAGMLGIAVSNSISKVAPHGGVRAVFGTNPFAFGAPRKNGKSLMLDMATTAISGAKVMKLAELGEELPEGIAVDPQGNPILDPGEVSKGVLLSFGGAKGYGLTLMIEILSSVISGAVFSTEVNSMFTDFDKSGENGHFFIAIDISRFINMDIYYERTETLFSAIKNSKGELADREVMIPGEARWVEYAKNQVEGIPLDEATVKALRNLSREYHVPVPF